MTSGIQGFISWEGELSGPNIHISLGVQMQLGHIIYPCIASDPPT